MKSKSRRKKIKRKQEKKSSRLVQRGGKGRKFPVKEFAVFFLVLFFLGYLVYTIILITGIKKNDPLSENGSSVFLLSNESSDDLNETLWIFEEGLGSDSKISSAFLVASNRDKSFILNI